jgi:putative aminopeptidase FrvX
MITSELSLTLLETLCAAPGISGFEQPVAAALGAYLGQQGVECQVDRVGNLLAHVPGSGPRVLLVAHMDEVGFVVRKIERDGFLRLERVGGSAVQALAGEHVIISGDSGPVPGVVGIVPPHLKGEASTDGLGSMYVDAGFRSKAAALECGVQVGSPVCYNPRFQKLQNCVAAKALDDRAGCALLAQLAAEVKNGGAACDLYLGFVVQEENVLVGGMPLLNVAQPDWVLGVDATLTYDSPDFNHPYSEVALGDGPAIKIMDHIRGRGQGLIAHPMLRRHIETVAKQANLPLQREVAVGISTAVAPMPFQRVATPTAAVSFPLRYSHSPAEVADLGDLHQTLQLLHGIVADPWPG